MYKLQARRKGRLSSAPGLQGSICGSDVNDAEEVTCKNEQVAGIFGLNWVVSVTLRILAVPNRTHEEVPDRTSFCFWFLSIAPGAMLRVECSRHELDAYHVVWQSSGLAHCHLHALKGSENRRIVLSPKKSRPGALRDDWVEVINRQPLCQFLEKTDAVKAR